MTTRAAMTLANVAVILDELEHYYWCATRSVTRSPDDECDCGKDEAAEMVGRMADGKGTT